MRINTNYKQKRWLKPKRKEKNDMEINLQKKDEIKESFKINDLKEIYQII